MANDDAGADGTTNETGFGDVFFSAADGLRLHARDYAPGTHAAGNVARIPVICLPGLTRNVRDFHPLAAFLSTRPDAARRVVSLDYRGRGLSAWDRDARRYSIVVEAEDALAAMTALGIERAAFIGTSRGALIIHVIAGMRPGAIASAVLNDAGPEIDGAGLAQIKGYLERMPLPRDWPEAARLLEEAHGRAFPALTAQDWTWMARAIYSEGRKNTLVTDYDPAIVGLLKDIDFNTRLPTLWPQFAGLGAVPLMTIRGEHSTLLSKQTVTEMAQRHPGMTTLEAKGQGHPPLLHRDGIDAAIARFLDAHDPA